MVGKELHGRYTIQGVFAKAAVDCRSIIPQLEARAGFGAGLHAPGPLEDVMN
jgi:hypothetical protein